jgi:hypothetical protein
MEDDPGKKKYHALAYYSLAHASPSFIHQLVVDAYAARPQREARNRSPSHSR